MFFFWSEVHAGISKITKVTWHPVKLQYNTRWLNLGLAAWRYLGVTVFFMPEPIIYVSRVWRHFRRNINFFEAAIFRRNINFRRDRVALFSAAISPCNKITSLFSLCLHRNLLDFIECLYKSIVCKQWQVTYPVREIALNSTIPHYCDCEYCRILNNISAFTLVTSVVAVKANGWFILFVGSRHNR